MTDLIEIIEKYPQALTVEELSKLISISEKSLYRYIGQRKLPAFRIGGNIRLNPKTTADWLRSRLS